MKRLLSEIFRFLLVGGAAFLIDILFLYLFTDIIGIHYLISAVIAFLGALAFNYILTLRWVFQKGKSKGVSGALIFLALSVIGLIINQIILYLAVERININYLWGKVIAALIVMVYNFITRKLFIEGNGR